MLETAAALVESVIDRLNGLFAIGGPFSIPVMLGALVFSALYYTDRRRERGRRPSLRGCIKAIFPRKVIYHRSTKVDLGWWIINMIVLATAYGFFAVGEIAWRNGAVEFLTAHLGAHAPLVLPVWAMMAIVTITGLLAYEFGYWSVHYLFHIVPALWEFHKTHHSAEVMTTLTEMRTHPVELVMMINSIAFWTGMAYGANVYVFGPGAHPFTLFNANIVLMVFIMTVGHLRHTNMWIAFGGWLGKIFQSPAHHKIHHSDQPKHFNKNLGFSLAVWDWVFGTLYVPNTHEPITIGVGASHADFKTLADGFIMPFVRAAEPWTKKWRALKKGESAAPVDAQRLQS